MHIAAATEDLMHRAADVRIQMDRIDKLHLRKRIGQSIDRRTQIANSVAMIFSTMSRDQHDRASGNFRMLLNPGV